MTEVVVSNVTRDACSFCCRFGDPQDVTRVQVPASLSAGEGAGAHVAVIRVICFCLIVSAVSIAPLRVLATESHHLSTGAAVKTYKVVLSKSDMGSNREVYIQAKDSSEAREIAKDQNPGWQVEMVSEVKK